MNWHLFLWIALGVYVIARRDAVILAIIMLLVPSKVFWGEIVYKTLDQLGFKVVKK